MFENVASPPETKMDKDCVTRSERAIDCLLSFIAFNKALYIDQPTSF